MLATPDRASSLSRRPRLRPRSAPVAAVGGCAFAVVLAASPAAAQMPGGPLFFEPSYAYDARAGVDFGHGGEPDGRRLLGSGTLHVWIGNCRRASVSAGAGIWNPPGEEGNRLAAGGGVQVLLNPCPSPTAVSALTFRVVSDVAAVRSQGRTRVSLSAGLGAGLKLVVPLAHLEPWIVPQLTRWDSAVHGGEATWKPGVSFGVNAGLSGTVGVRVGAHCCQDGLAAAYGLSLWF